MAADPLLCIGRLHISGNAQALRAVDDWLHGLQSQYDWDARLQFKMEVVLHEVLPNIFEHAAHPEETPLEIALFKGDADYRLQVVDQGMPFDPLHQPAFVAPDTLEAASVNGRGIHLIRQFTDKQSYLRVNEKNVLTLYFIS